MRTQPADQDLFLELERGFRLLEKIERVHRRVLCARRLALTCVMALGSVVLAVILGTPAPAA